MLLLVFLGVGLLHDGIAAVLQIVLLHHLLKRVNDRLPENDPKLEYSVD